MLHSFHWLPILDLHINKMFDGTGINTDLRDAKNYQQLFTFPLKLRTILRIFYFCDRFAKKLFISELEQGWKIIQCVADKCPENMRNVVKICGVDMCHFVNIRLCIVFCSVWVSRVNKRTIWDIKHEKNWYFVTSNACHRRWCLKRWQSNGIIDSVIIFHWCVHFLLGQMK